MKKQIIKIAKFCLFSLVLIFSISLKAYALESFVVRDVRVQGLQRIQVGTVLNYLPIRIGQKLTQRETSRIISALYRTGFFKNVSLARSGSTLIIKVVERSTIGVVFVHGNKDIPREKLDVVLKNIGLVQGHVYDPAVLDKVKRELKDQYNNRGKYNATIETSVSAMKRNRVTVTINIKEGRVAKIKEIRIIGNKAFTDKQLLKQFVLRTPGFLTFFSQRDQYSKEKLNASVESLQSFYMDHGYIKAKIQSTQVSLSTDRRHVFITLKIYEGARYYFDNYKFTGKLILPREQLRSMVHIKKGDVFSRKVVNSAINDIGLAIGDKGYGFPSINADPVIDEKSKRISITFYIDPGVRVYVRHINFVGNTKTADYVLRHAMRQEESSMLRITKIKDSERRLRNLGYFKNVSVKTKPVAGTNNQVDLDYHVTETPSTTASASVGYGSLGFQFNAGINEPNFLGTGRTVGINFSTRSDYKDYSVNYFNPYYYEGIGRGFNAYFQQYTPGKETTISNYATNRFGGDVTYNFDVADDHYLTLGGGYEHLDIPRFNAATPEYVAFVAANGKNFNLGHVTAGWTYNSYDQKIFPTKGYHQQVSAKVSYPFDGSLAYYKVGLTAHMYVPLFHGMILSLQSGVGYGGGFGTTHALPFFENYYAGGAGGQGQVRGYDNYSLGPRDSSSSMNPIGGNFLVTGSVGVVLPWPFSRDTLRTTLFVDGGNVYNAYGDNVPPALLGSGEGPFRFSAGVGFEWRSPFGPLQFSLATPLNKQPGDKTQLFQFNMATGF